MILVFIHLSQGDYTACYLLSKRVLESDPFQLDILPAHLASLVLMLHIDNSHNAIDQVHQIAYQLL